MAEDYGTFRYYDQYLGMKTGKCDLEHLHLFEGKKLYMDYSNPWSSPRIRVGQSGPSAKALVLDALSQQVWSDRVRPKLWSRHIAVKNKNHSDLRSSNLELGATTGLY